MDEVGPGEGGGVVIRNPIARLKALGGGQGLPGGARGPERAPANDQGGRFMPSRQGMRWGLGFSPCDDPREEPME